MRKLTRRISIHFTTQVGLVVIWVLWIVLSMSGCYIKRPFESNEIIREAGFINWLVIIFVIVEVVLLFMKRYLYLVIGSVGCFWQTVYSIISVLANNMMTKVYGSIVYCREPDGGYVKYDIREFTTRGYICIAVGLILLLLHVYILIKKNKTQKETS